MPKSIDHRSRYEIEALERHAAAEARSAADRRARNVPRRDDLNRAAYYILLLMTREAEAQDEIERAMRIRRRMRLALEDAGFDPEASIALFDDHIDTAADDLTRWVGMRRIAREQAAVRADRSAAE